MVGGPPWLKLPLEDWPSGESQPDEDTAMEERRKAVVSFLLCKDIKAGSCYYFSNDYDNFVRVLAWVLQFVNSCRKQRIEQCMEKILQYKEILLTEKCIIRHVKREYFAGLHDERIACLDPFLDEKGIIRLRTTIVERADVGLDSAFAHLKWEQISKYCAFERIEWRFNPPAAAWWGVWWERLIRLLKQLLC
jgi:hypothetical protein